MTTVGLGVVRFTRALAGLILLASCGDGTGTTDAAAGAGGGGSSGSGGSAGRPRIASDSCRKRR